MRRLAKILLALWLGAVAAAPAFAHATLVRSDPPDGGLVAEPPTAVVMTFNEAVTPTAFRLVDPDGRGVALAAHAGVGGTINVPVPAGLGQGTHVLSWRVVSGDGHPVAGALLFSVGAPSAGVADRTPVAVTPGWLKAAIWLARVTLYLALLAGVGGVFFAAWLTPPAGPPRAPALWSLPFAGQRLVTGLLLAGVVAAPAALALQGLDLVGGGLADLFIAAPWQTAFASSYFATILIALTALLLGLVGSALPRAPARALSAAAVLGIGFAFSASGHASTAPPRDLMWAVVFLHTVAVAFWVGALAPLAILLASGARTAGAALANFSAAIPFALLPLLVAGVILAVVQVETVANLWRTPYGRLLAAKLLLVALLFGLAAWNRGWLTRGARRGERAAVRRLSRSVAAETVVVVLVLGVVAGWRFTPPPRSLAAAAAAVAAAGKAAPFFAHIHGERSAVNAIIDPGQIGPVSVRVEPLTTELIPLSVLDVEVSLAFPDAGVAPIRRPARLEGGVWIADGFILPLAGIWIVRVDLTISDFVAEALEAPVVILAGPRPPAPPAAAPTPAPDDPP